MNKAIAAAILAIAALAGSIFAQDGNQNPPDYLFKIWESPWRDSNDVANPKDLAALKSVLKNALDEVAKKHPWAAKLMSKKDLKINIEPRTSDDHDDKYLITGKFFKGTITLYVPKIYAENDSPYSIMYPRLEMTLLHELVHYEQSKLITYEEIQAFETSEEKMLMLMFQEYDAFFKSDTISSEKYKSGATTKIYDNLFKDLYSNRLDMFAELLPREIYEDFCRLRNDSEKPKRLSMCYSGKKIFDDDRYKTWFEAEFPDCKGEHLPECLTEFKAESNLAKAISKASATRPDANLRLSPAEAVGIIKFIQTNMIQPEEQRKAVHSARLGK